MEDSLVTLSSTRRSPNIAKVLPFVDDGFCPKSTEQRPWIALDPITVKVKRHAVNKEGEKKEESDGTAGGHVVEKEVRSAEQICGYGPLV